MSEGADEADIWIGIEPEYPKRQVRRHRHHEGGGRAAAEHRMPGRTVGSFIDHVDDRRAIAINRRRTEIGDGKDRVGNIRRVIREAEKFQ